MKALARALLILAAMAGPAWASSSDSVDQMGDRIAQAVDKAARNTTDTVITRRVQRKLWGDRLVKTDHIQVSVKEGRVQLKGSVASTEERDRALSLAQKTEGVELVTDKMMVHKG